MKIGITSEQLNRPLTGRGYYIYHLIKILSSNTNKNNYDIYLINYKNTQMFPNLKHIILENPFKRITKSYQLWYLYLPLGLYDISKKVDIVHCINAEPIYLKPKNIKLITTIYDIIPYLFPKTYTFSTSFRFRFILPKTLKISNKIITISHHTKQDIIKHFKIPEDKIKVIHLAANENYKPLNEKEIEKIREKYNLNYPFILYVGGLEPKKNISTLLKALYKLKKQGIKHKLVITGEKRWKYKSIFETIEKLNLQKDVIFTGYVPDEDLPALYNAADLFVYPSLYEGFGLPPLEAMACGTPVITSSTSSLPEVVGDAGIMVNPYDVDELAKAMYEVLTNDGLREELSKKGLERAKLFSWKKCAEEHLKVYEEVYNMK
ncbi:glycosyltransferase family 4 protein [Methanotorris formicicus]|uniref:Glycosyl transferase group 1 n=2 Tax=Methanotorris formicicus TaxID=213185 RepID=H1L0E6_9EURY|nr:glycosyltransferase family 1 protein [Methanotorris formicicus]EHP84940.1 glycosyl transferase group 1 [Methanotorris formicicus Mc-S-70]